MSKPIAPDKATKEGPQEHQTKTTNNSRIKCPWKACTKAPSNATNLTDEHPEKLHIEDLKQKQIGKSAQSAFGNPIN